MSKIRILVVEDETVVARDIGGQLEALGHQAVAAYSRGEDALDHCAKDRPDLVLMDIRLAGKLDGIEVAGTLRDRWFIPVVFLTAFAGESFLERAAAVQPYGYIVKPFDECELRVVIEMAWRRYQSDLELKRRREEMDAVFHASMDGFCTIDRTGRIIDVNDAICHMSGFTREELLQKSVADLDVDRNPEQIAANITRIVGGQSTLVEHRFRRKDGQIRLIELSATCSPGPDTRLYYFARDVTERRRVDESIRQFHRAVEQSPVSIVITDTAGLITYVNPHFEQITGYSAAEAIGQNPRLLKASEQSEEFYRRLWATITSGQVWHGEFRNRRKNDELYWEDASISPVRDDQGRITHFIAVKEDITDRKRSEEQLLQSKAELQQANAQLCIAIAQARELAIAAEAANRAKSAFLTSMSHELRTPLNAINGIAATLGEQATDSGQKTSLSLILESGQHLLGIIEEILDYSGFQAGKTRIEAKPFDLPALVARVIRLVGDSVRRHQLTLTCWIDERVPAEVTGDARRLGQVLLNLLINAVKFTEHGGIHLGVTAKADPTGAWTLSFAVCDTGPGITPMDLARLFQPFSQVGAAPDRLASGTGLGLVIARSYARLMGGDIAVRSQPGRGSVFRCTVVVGGTPNSGKALASLAPAALHSRPILIVTDSPRHRRLFAAVARSWNLSASVLPGRGITASLLNPPQPFAFAILDPEAVRDGMGALARWLAPGAPGHTVPVAWLHHFDPPSRPKTALPGMDLPCPLEPTELARAMTELAHQTAAPVPAPQPRPAAKLGELIPLRVLAADDIRTNREMLRGMMAHLGYTIELAVHGAEVLSALSRNTFDLVLLDVQMPVMDGLTAAREICRLQPDPARRPKLVAVTANALPGDREKCLVAGMDDYLSKPVLPRHLDVCLRRLFQTGVSSSPSQVAPVVSPAPTDSPWVDQAHLESVTAGLPPAEAAATLVELQASAGDDFSRVWPQLAAACEQRDAHRLAELTHGLKGCFLSMGWMCIARRCIDVLGEARKEEFAAWGTFPAELKELFKTSNEEMSGYLARHLKNHPVAVGPATVDAAGTLAALRP